MMSLQDLAQPLQTALKLGLQFPALATVAVAALERWEAGQADDLAKLAPSVVPSLKPYLQDVSQIEAVEPVPDTPAGGPSTLYELSLLSAHCAVTKSTAHACPAP